MHSTATRFEILSILYSLLVYFEKTYCFPSRNRILELLSTRFKRYIGLSCLDYHLGILKKYKYIVSYPNYGRLDDGTFYGKSSNRYLMGKAFHLLKQTGVTVVQYLWDWLKETRVNGQPKDKNNNLPQQDLDQRSDSGFEKISLPEIDEPP